MVTAHESRSLFPSLRRRVFRSCVFVRTRSSSGGFAHERGQPVSRRWQSPRDQFRIHTYSRRSVLRCLTVALAFGARPIAYRTSWGSTRRVTPRVYNGTRKRVRNDSCLARVQPLFSGSATQKRRNGTERREGLYVHNFRVWCLRESCGCTAPEGKYLCPPPTFEPTRRAQEEKEEAAFAVRYRSSVHLRADRNTARSLWRTYRRSGPCSIIR